MKISLKKIFARLFILVASLVVFFLVGEVAFRLSKGDPLSLSLTTGTDKARSPYLFEPNSSWRLPSSKPGEFDVLVSNNNFGFRGKDIALEKKPGTTRIFMVGDSFTFGVGAENDETAPYLVEEMLTKEGRDAEVVNAGRGHASTIFHYLKIRDSYLDFKPDIVLLLFDFSDLEDDWRIEKHLVYDKAGKPLYSDPAVTGGKTDWWFLAKRNSRFCQYIDKKIIRTIDKMRVLGLKDYLKAAIEGKRAKSLIVNLKNEKAGIDTIAYDHYLFIRGREKLPAIRQHWQRTAKYLLMIRDLLKEKGVDFILVAYPYGIHVGPDQWSEGRAYWGFEKEKTYTDYYAFDLIREFAEENGIPFINTLDTFLENNDTVLFFPFDGHLTPRGNEVLAAAIVKNALFRRALQGHVLHDGQEP